MTAQQRPDLEKSKPQTAVPALGNARKAWIRKTPVDIVLDQIRKQEARVADMEKELNQEKRGLQKLLEAKKVLEAK